MELIERIDLRFRSGNSIPVERAHITADEWSALKRMADAAAVGLAMLEAARPLVLSLEKLKDATK